MSMDIYDPEVRKQLAEAAELYYVYDSMPGISRRRCGKGFAYYSPDGKHLKCKQTIARIKSLAVPPAYEDVWICPLENGHLQATGRDARERKQYRYHPKWHEVREQTKFEFITLFGEYLPTIRERVELAIKSYHHLNREAVLAAMIKIMDQTYIRIGNSEYSQQNKTYGITTIRKKHSHVEGNEVYFDFEGKNHTEWHISIEDSQLAKIVKECEEIPGYELFKYIDEDGKKCDVSSQHINSYLKEITQQPFTAKNFRTWAACEKLFTALIDTPVPSSERQQQITYNKIVETIATELGHTVAVCKKSYLPAALHDAWIAKTLPNQLLSSSDKHFSASEASFLLWWKQKDKGA